MKSSFIMSQEGYCDVEYGKSKEKGEWEVLIEVYSSDEKLLTSKKELFKVI